MRAISSSLFLAERERDRQSEVAPQKKLFLSASPLRARRDRHKIMGGAKIGGAFLLYPYLVFGRLYKFTE